MDSLNLTRSLGSADLADGDIRQEYIISFISVEVQRVERRITAGVDIDRLFSLTEYL